MKMGRLMPIELKVIFRICLVLISDMLQINPYLVHYKTINNTYFNPLAERISLISIKPLSPKVVLLL